MAFALAPSVSRTSACVTATSRRATSARRCVPAAAARSSARETCGRERAAARSTRSTARGAREGALGRRALGRTDATVARASAAGADKPLDHVMDKLRAKGKDAVQVLMLLGLFGCWYGFNIVFNIYNKQILKLFPYPVTVTLIELGIGSALIAAMWASGAKKPPTLTKDMLKPIVPLAVIHAVGNLLTNVSLGKVAVSFTHTVKASEPFFSVLLSSIFLGDVPSLAVILALVPVVGGVALASMTEVSFCWAGFLAALGSNITFQSRNVLSKKMMGMSVIKGAIDNINLFSVITMLSCVVCLPVAIGLEGVRFTPAAIAATGANISELAKALMVAGFCFQMYQQISYMILSRVSPVTHSVGNCMKRVTVIVVTLLYFKNPVSPLNMVGTAMALGGVFLYSRAKRAEGQKKKLVKAASETNASEGYSAYNDQFRKTTGLSNIG